MGWMVPVGIVGAVSARHAFTTWVKAKHGYPIGEDGRRSRRGRYAQVDGDIEAERKIMLLTNENEKLTGQVSRLEERIAVLERIATDPAERTAREIEALRDR
ncbi:MULTISPECIES: hypothetical protein [unclassified Sphingomonas]|uniref:hypothetical protein n=1 Tax=unclassified Sphingomonas TaxID=196159 RepID=UPI000E10E5AA|nr:MULTISPECIES: hypothetical protein [unclassified Sphingomonas]AXJ94230.1 hypothetical protein DM480_00685 [Sphingomonas sp. FARSPH]